MPNYHIAPRKYKQVRVYQESYDRLVAYATKKNITLGAAFDEKVRA